MNRTSMHEPLETKRMIVREFIDLIQTIPDDEEQATVQKFLRYLQSLLRIKQVVPPVVEIMTVVKHTKPVLFHAARRTVLKSSNLFMLFQLDMSFPLAQERLEDYLK
ncbi:MULTISPECIES: hypothetical protein [Brevibacillus]|uniref:Uncharacterized protein n=1 Tax=Brevibacillus invocatus TaxID=173959 RepID=A0A3M8CLB8_9BACL|nr:MULTISPECIES: hypothetical protein [Brevibacillus]MCM3079849.1 hypothetical protein [Brevibacillus invocatus]MCM3430042.1 hypothetical protein [Brevibacillus invocatus]MDH4616600.1 hypothetical protein [Brevibacillus sp. AY1]RNB76418.1 hypothetical protein EDM52_03565 [Brevibacillus invocatus]